MIPPSDRGDLIRRLRFTFGTADYAEIDQLIAALREKDNFEQLCEEFFQGCRIDSAGRLLPSGFFAGGNEHKSASLHYAMYEILGRAPDTFLLKHRVSRVKLRRGNSRKAGRLPRGIFSLPRLEVLSAPENGLRDIPDEAAGARSLKLLDLSSNHLTEFPAVLFELTGLAALNLSFNALTSIPRGLGRLGSLRVLTLRGNRIIELPGDWHRLQYLRKLDLSMNRLSELPDSIRTLTSLQELKVSYNDLPASTEAAWEKAVHAGGSAWAAQGSLNFGGLGQLNETRRHRLG